MHTYMYTCICICADVERVQEGLEYIHMYTVCACVRGEDVEGAEEHEAWSTHSGRTDVTVQMAPHVGCRPAPQARAWREASGPAPSQAQASRWALRCTIRGGSGSTVCNLGRDQTLEQLYVYAHTVLAGYTYTVCTGKV